MPLLLDWRMAAQPDDLVRQVVAVLQQGGLAALPTDAGYAIVASAAATDAVNALTAFSGEQLAPLETLVTAPGNLVELLSGLFPPIVLRLVDRLWPGPLGVIASSQQPKLTWDLGRFRSQDHTLISALLAAAGCPLFGRTIVGPAGSEETAANVSKRSARRSP